MTYEQPPRLKHDSEFGPLLRAADVDVTAERLARNAAGVKTAIAAGATVAVWKFLIPLLFIAALLVPTNRRDAGQAAIETPPLAPAGEGAPPIETADLRVTQTQPDTTVPPLADKPAPAVIHAPKLIPEIAAVPAPSDLPEQIRLYEAARDAGKQGDLVRAVDLVDELLRRFPATQLRPDAELTRAELLARANRVAEATRALAALIDDPAHRGRRGELLRTLGDLHRRNGDCTHAIEAYNRALADSRLSDRDRADIERGRDRCTQP